MPATRPQPANDALIARDTADLLLRQSLGGIGVSFAASSFLAFMELGRSPHMPVFFWWAAMTILLAVRALDALVLRRARMSRQWSGRREIRRFAWGVAGTAAMWIAFPLLFFGSLDPIGRTTLAIVLSAMATGGSTVLAASLGLSIGFSAAMLLPVSVLFLRAAEPENQILGGLGFLFFIIMVLSSRVSHSSAMSAIRLHRTNEGLLTEVEGQRNLAERKNDELKSAQFALRQSNCTLEDRIRARTIDLEREIAERERYAQERARLASTDSAHGPL